MNSHSCSCSGCGCGCGESSRKQVTIEFLYIDLDSCDRCRSTETTLDAAIAEVTPALQTAGYRIDVNKVLVETRDMAIRYRLLSSPTIRVNGQDIAPRVKETPCACCGELCGEDVDCRVWEYEGLDYTSPPKALIAEAILRAAFSDAQPAETPYALPHNLEKFFSGKE